VIEERENMSTDSPAQCARRPQGRRALAALVVATALVVGGCRTHNEPLAYVCTVNGKPVAVVVGSHGVIVGGRRGAIALARIGLTPTALKAAQNCRAQS
jgi:hypothetical protein